MSDERLEKAMEKAYQKRAERDALNLWQIEMDALVARCPLKLTPKLLAMYELLRFPFPREVESKETDDARKAVQAIELWQKEMRALEAKA